MSYEGVAVRFADTLAYIGRDIEDAIMLRYIERSDLPESCTNLLGNTNRKIMNTLIMDLLSYSLNNNTIGYSEQIFKALNKLQAQGKVIYEIKTGNYSLML